MINSIFYRDYLLKYFYVYLACSNILLKLISSIPFYFSLYSYKKIKDYPHQLHLWLTYFLLDGAGIGNTLLAIIFSFPDVINTRGIVVLFSIFFYTISSL